MADKAGADKPHYLGHRARLREKLLERGPNALADYELLEILLGIAIPRRDTKPLAKELLAKFGSFSGVINASAEELRTVSGVGESTVAALKAVQAATVRATRDEALTQPILSGWTALLDYLKADMAYRKSEQFRVLFLDSKNMLLSDEVVHEGTINHAPVYPRDIMGRAISLGATAIILCHNHPSGKADPSRQDIAMTREIMEVGKKLNVNVHDHVIIGKHGSKSLKTLGLMD